MVSTGSLEIEHGDANEGVELLKQALEVDNAYHEPLLILSDLFRNEEDYEAIIALLSYVDEDDLDPVFMWHLAHAFSQEERDKEAQHFFELAYPTMKTQSAFLSDYYYYLIEIGYKEKAQTILQQLIKWTLVMRHGKKKPIVLIINVGDSFDSNTYTNETKLY